MRYVVLLRNVLHWGLQAQAPASWEDEMIGLSEKELAEMVLICKYYGKHNDARRFLDILIERLPKKVDPEAGKTQEVHIP